jgi:hypothetical protein
MTEILAEGKGGAARTRPKDLSQAKGEPQARATQRSDNPERKAMSRRTETAYKAQSPGKLAQHNKAPGSRDRVNAAVV